MDYGKRGLSPVIATVLLLVVTVTAIIILAQFIIPFIKKSLSQSSECLPYRQYFEFVEKFESLQGDKMYNCYDTLSGLHGISVRANTINTEDSNRVAGFNAVFSDEGEAKVVLARENASVSYNEGGIRMLKLSAATIKIPKIGEIQTYVFNSTNKAIYKEAKISPVLANGRICEITDSIKLIACQTSLEIP